MKTHFPNIQIHLNSHTLSKEIAPRNKFSHISQMHIPIGTKGNPLTKTFSALPEEHIMHTLALILYILGFFQMAIASL